MLTLSWTLPLPVAWRALGRALLSPALIGTLALAAAPADAQVPASALVTTEWLEANISQPKLRVVEVSVEPGLFERGHIPNASNVVWHTDLVDTVNRDIASPEKFQALARRLGLDRDTTVVLYGDNNNWFAAWGAWVLAQYGLTDNVKLLDGGRRKWEAEKRPLDTRSADVRPSAFTVAERSETLRARLPEVLAVAKGEKRAKIVDIRSPDEFSGKIIAPAGFQELAIRAGSIPTSVNVPWARAVNADGTIKSRDELKKIYADAGIDGSQPVITTCRIGERSSHTWFVLTRILGYEAKNYDGSWTEYGNTVGVPIVNAAGTVWGGK